MNIKKFVATSNQEAINLVKRDMGPDAVILQTRTIRGSSKGTGRFEEKIEVTAAIDYEPQRDEDKGAESSGSQDVFRRWEVLESKLKEVETVFRSLEASSLLKPQIYFNRTLMSRLKCFKRFGLNPEVIKDLLQETEPIDNNTNRSERKELRNCLLSALRQIHVDDARKARERRIYAFVGPTGVGKTTTLAKLAALSSIKRGEKVAIVTVDTLRIAAIAQLETYARIMKLPLEVASNRNELQEAVRKHGDCSTIFIDTAGRSPNNRPDLEKLRALLNIRDEIHHYLVLSATTRYQNLLNVDRQYEAVPFKSYIFTKLDEVEDVSPIFNFLISRDRPISYFTTGQQVPEDIEPASRKKLAALMLSHNETGDVNTLGEAN